MGSRMSNFMSRVTNRRANADARNNNATVIENKYALTEEHITYFIPVELLNPALLPYLPEYGISTSKYRKHGSNFDITESVFEDDGLDKPLGPRLKNDQLFESLSVDQIPMGIPLPVTFRNGQPIILTPKLHQKQMSSQDTDSSELKLNQKTTPKAMSRIQKIKQRFRRRLPGQGSSIEVSVEQNNPEKQSPSQQQLKRADIVEETTKTEHVKDEQTAANTTQNEVNKTSDNKNKSDDDKKEEEVVVEAAEKKPESPKKVIVTEKRSQEGKESVSKKPSHEDDAKIAGATNQSSATPSMTSLGQEAKTKVSRKSSSKSEASKVVVVRKQSEAESKKPVIKENLSNQKSGDGVSRKKSLKEKRSCQELRPAVAVEKRLTIEKVVQKTEASPKAAEQSKETGSSTGEAKPASHDSPHNSSSTPTPNAAKIIYSTPASSSTVLRQQSKEVVKSQSTVVTSQSPVVSSHSTVLTSQSPVVSSQSTVLTAKSPVVTSQSPAAPQQKDPASAVPADIKKERRAKKVKRHKSTMEKETLKEVSLRPATKSEKDFGALQRDSVATRSVSNVQTDVSISAMKISIKNDQSRARLQQAAATAQVKGSTEGVAKKSSEVKVKQTNEIKVKQAPPEKDSDEGDDPNSSTI